MEQLPPKAPMSMGMGHPWPSFPAAPSSWVDDFLDFSSTRRSAHRRTVSDPIAFVEEPHRTGAGGIGFERLDDEQLRNMFSDEVVASSSATPSDHNSDDDDHKPKLDSSTQNASPDAIIDPKRIKRILANRQSAQRSRVRKLQYISELERSVSSLQTEVSTLSPRVAFLDHHRLLLNVDNSALKQRIAALAQDKIFKDAHQEALKKEIERLRKVYHEQNMTKMDGDAPSEGAAAAFNKRRGCPEDE